MVTQLEPAPVAAARRSDRPAMGYQPALDGLRAVSVAVVIAYHAHALGAAGLGFARGGFLGVEVFFVVSGYLITALLLEECRRVGWIDARRFWMRRARRLLPALFVMLATVALAALLWRRDTLERFRHDLLGAVFYVSNWQQIATKAGYFASLESPPLLRHLWSLAVEEQWYLVWPLALALLVRRTRGDVRVLRAVIGGAALASMLAMAVLYRAEPTRVNLVYLSTFTRASGLLVGALLATGWTPWAWPGASRRHLVALDGVGLAALAGIALAVVTLTNESAALYRGGLAAVSLLSAVAVAAAVHPGARWLTNGLAHPWLAAIGRRSYGLYLWHWPVFVLLRAGEGAGRLVAALVLSVALAVACYRLVELPVRAGALGRWWSGVRAGLPDRRRALALGAVPLAFVVPLGVGVAVADAPDAASDPSADVAFEGATTTTAASAFAPSSAAAEGPASSDAAGGVSTESSVPPEPTTTTTAGPGPVRVVLVGDSQAHSLFVNQPSGLEKVMTLSNGAVEGCGLFNDGSLESSSGWNKGITDCGTWPAKWAQSARNASAEVALVVLGAWDVFDLRLVRGWLVFGTEPHDAELRARLADGIASLRSTGVKVALLEIPCMRPVDNARSPVPALPERGQDNRIAHLNDLLREAAAADPENVTFVTGPTEWCGDQAIASDLSYRWDGVHVYKPGAKLVFDTVAAAVVAAAGRAS